MKLKPTRSTAFVIGLAIVAFVVGLAAALFGPRGQTVSTIVGALGIAAGLVLLASRSLVKTEHGVAAGRQIPARHLATRRIRVGGAAGILLGLALLIPDMRIRTAVMLCAVAVSMAGVFRVPKRLFIVEGPGE
jgi:hypothetical protein